MTNEEYIVDLKLKTPGIKPAIDRIKELEAEISKVDASTLEYIKLLIELQKVQNASGKSTAKFGVSIQDLKNKLGDFAGKTLENLGKKLGLSQNAMLGIGVAAGAAVTGVAAIATGLVALGVAAVNSANQFKDLEKQLKSTGATGNQLKEIANQAAFLQESFNIDATSYATGINALVANFGLTATEAAAAIEKVSIAGGNSTGQLIDLITEYSTQAAAGGVSASRFFDLIVSGASQGSFQQDKLLDVIKEVGLRYKENTKATSDALKPLGDEFNKNLRAQFESGAIAIDDVLLKVIDRSKQLGLSQTQLQTIIADLGGGPLEDIGKLETAYKKLKDSADATNISISKLTATELEQIDRTRNKIALQRELADTLGNDIVRAQNSVTDAVFEVLAAIDTSGDGIKGLTNSVISFIEGTGVVLKSLVIAFNEFKPVLEGLGTAARVTFAIMSGGISELLRFLPDVVTYFDEATGAAKRFNDERDRKITTKSTQELVGTLQDLSIKYKEVGTIGNQALEGLLKVTQKLAESANSDGAISAAETERIQQELSKRTSVIDAAESRLVKIRETYNGKISADQQEALNNELEFYKANVVSIATVDGELTDQIIKNNEDGLNQFLQTLILKDTATKKANDKTLKDAKKLQKDLVQAEIDAFNKLKQSFQDNFESQRLEAQKQFLNGLITEEQLQQKLFAINQQESDVIITITANKKDIAKTGQESLEISTEEVKKAKGIADELDRQLAIRQKIRDAERSIQDSEFSISSSELRVEEENAIQSILTDTSIKNEEKRQKKIEKTKKQFAIRQRQLTIEDTKRQIDDAAKAADDLQKVLDEQSANGPSEEIDLFKTDKLAQDIAQIQKLKAELGLLNTQQIEAQKELKKPDESLVEKAERYNSYIQAITQGFQQANQADIAATEASLSAQEARIQAGVELAKLGNEELLNQELERQDKLLEEREKQANKEKAIAAIQTAANLAVAITKAASQGGILAPANIALVLGAVGIGLATIPSLISGFFADGVIGFNGKGTERSDSNLVAISRGESVITAKGTKNASKMLTMINEGKLKDSDYLTAGLDLAPIQAVNQAIDIRNELNQQIALSSELLEEMRNFEYKIKFDAKGMNETINTKNRRITKINRN